VVKYIGGVLQASDSSSSDSADDDASGNDDENCMATFAHSVGIGRAHNESPKASDSDTEEDVLRMMKRKVAQAQTRKAAGERSNRTRDDSDSCATDSDGSGGEEPRTTGNGKVDRRTAVSNALRSADAQLLHLNVERESVGNPSSKRGNPSAVPPKPKTTQDEDEEEVHISVTCQPLRSNQAQGRKTRSKQQAPKYGEGEGEGEGEEGLLCHVCKASFATRNQLFKHIKETGHAVPQAQEPKGRVSRNDKKKANKR
jgi:hypothetical protein